MEEQPALEKLPPRTEAPLVIQGSAYDLGSVDVNPLHAYWQVLVRRRWTILSILLVVLVTVAIGTFKQRPVYSAKAVMQIDKENTNILSFKDFLDIDGGEEMFLETAYRNLQSRTLVRDVIQKLQMDRLEEFNRESLLPSLSFFSPPKPQAGVVSDDTALDPKMQRTIERFLDHLAVNPVRRSRLVEISFESYDPFLASRVVNTLATNFIDENLQVKWEATQRASELISQQLVGLKAKLEKSEEDLQRYAKNNAILQVDEKQDMSTQKLKQLQEEYVKAEAELYQKESVYRQITANRLPNGDVTSVPGMMDNKLYQDLSTRLAELRRDQSDLATTFTPEYPKLKRLNSQIDEIERSMQKERGLLARKIADEYGAAVARVKLLKDSVADQTKEFNNIAEKSIQYNILKREVDTNRQLYEGLLQRLKEAGVSAGMKASNIRVVDQAEVPTKPTKPRVLLNLALALVLGLGLGTGLALFQESLDNTLKSPEDVQRYLQLPSLGVIPSALVKDGKGRGYGYGYGSGKKIAATAVLPAESAAQFSSELIAASTNWSLIEAYRSLRVSILLSTSNRLRTMLVTSAQPGEGKTTTAVNLAITLAQLGSRVLVIDADMRKPRVGEVLRVEANGRGLSTCLAGQHSLEESVASTLIPNVFVLPCGPVPPNPPELLSSKAMRQLLSDAKDQFDFVLLDSPPLLMVSDGRVLASQADGVILVAHGGSTSREAVNHAKSHLLQVNANVVGVTLNNVDLTGVGYGKYYYQGYGKAYGQGDAASSKVSEA
jgi:succinoglycan biosynthesis transport protein ExoP